jgi:hypothetical protein
VRFASGTPATVSISLAAHQTKWSLTLVGTGGSLEVMRGGWGGSRGEYALAIKRADEAEHQVGPAAGGGGAAGWWCGWLVVQLAGGAAGWWRGWLQQGLPASAWLLWGVG